MAIEKFKDLSNFPFSEYYKDIGQYMSAQNYWYTFLLETNGFLESDWRPRLGVIDIEALQTDGIMFQILNKDIGKEIFLSTRSFDGLVNMVKKDNQAMSEEDVSEAVELWKFTPTQAEIDGYSWKDAQEEVATFYKPSLIWVENNTYFQDISDHPDGGKEIPIERLILDSEISSQCEPLARQALELFLQGGSAMARVNDIFSPEEE